VLVPRPDTETLVDWALALLAGPLAANPAPAVADLGTGSGAVALAVRRGCPRAVLYASDDSAKALAVARGNGQRLALPVQWLHGDWWQPFAAAGVPPLALALSNPPYIAAGDPHLPALRHEPAAALVAGADGLDDLRRIVGAAPAHLTPGAWLLLEHGHDQGAAVRALLQGHGLQRLATRADLAGLDRCSGGCTGD
jgi:release factor glutamine methyltransferase